MVTSGSQDRARSTIGMLVVVFSLAGVVVASIVAVIAASPADRPDMARLVFTATLPVLGTWVGTILAFYFARENLQAATDSTIRLTAQAFDPSTPVEQVMIRREQISAYVLAAGESASSVSLKALNDRMVDKGYHRIPILDATGAVLYVVHDSTLARYAASVNLAPDALTQPLSELMKAADLTALITAFAFVTPSTRLAEARARMRSVANCNDLFVTTTGAPSEPVLGWLTNTLLASVT